MEKRLTTYIALWGTLTLGCVIENNYLSFVMIIMSIVLLTLYCIYKFKN